MKGFKSLCKTIANITKEFFTSLAEEEDISCNCCGDRSRFVRPEEMFDWRF